MISQFLRRLTYLHQNHQNNREDPIMHGETTRCSRRVFIGQYRAFCGITASLEYFFCNICTYNAP